MDSSSEESLRNTSKPNESLLPQAPCQPPGVGSWSVASGDTGEVRFCLSNKKTDSFGFEVLRSVSSCCDFQRRICAGSMSAPGGGQLVSGIRWHGWGLVSCCCVMISISLMLELWWALGSPLSSLWSGPGSSRRGMTLTALLLVTTHCSDLNQARPMTPRLKLQSEQLSTKYIDP